MDAEALFDSEIKEIALTLERVQLTLAQMLRMTSILERLADTAHEEGFVEAQETIGEWHKPS